MTAVEWPSLDKLLADATPVEPVPFDLDALIQHDHWCLFIGHGDCCGNAEEDCDCGAWNIREQIARYVNALRLDTARAQQAAVALEQENAHLTARITEAVGLLGDALLWCNDGYSNTADSISEAIAALRGEGE